MRVRNAWDYRKAVTDTSSCRVIFGEADFLPGIVIDKFSDVLVVESLALGIDRLKPVIVDKLRKVMAEEELPSGAYMSAAMPRSVCRREWSAIRDS